MTGIRLSLGQITVPYQITHLLTISLNN